MIDASYDRKKPPEDDCCPICFGEFKVPCKTNCGHWFCGGCILQLWEYRSRPRQCKCPFCTCSISKLTPEISTAIKIEDGVVDQVYENIENYNSYYDKGRIERCFMMVTFYLLKQRLQMPEYLRNLMLAPVMIFIKASLFVARFVSNVTKCLWEHNTYHLRIICVRSFLNTMVVEILVRSVLSLHLIEQAVLSVVLGFCKKILTEGHRMSQIAKRTWWWLDLALLLVILINASTSIARRIVDVRRRPLQHNTPHLRTGYGIKRSYASLIVLVLLLCSTFLTPCCDGCSGAHDDFV